MNHIYDLVTYTLYGMTKKIAFFDAYQLSSWSYALSKLNNNEYKAFEVISIQSVEVLGGGTADFLESI